MTYFDIYDTFLIRCLSFHSNLIILSVIEKSKYTSQLEIRFIRLKKSYDIGGKLSNYLRCFG